MDKSTEMFMKAPGPVTGTSFLVQKLLGLLKPGQPSESNPNQGMQIDPDLILKEMGSIGGSPASAYAHLMGRRGGDWQQSNQFGESPDQEVEAAGLPMGGGSGGAGSSGSFDGPQMPASDGMAQMPLDSSDSPEAATRGSAKNFVRYTVQPGDNLIRIAKRVYGDGSKYRILAEINGIQDPNMIQPGTQLVIPPGAQEV